MFMYYKVVEAVNSFLQSSDGEASGYESVHKNEEADLNIIMCTQRGFLLFYFLTISLTKIKDNLLFFHT